jgi:Protein of unknown function (DUF2911)
MKKSILFLGIVLQAILGQAQFQVIQLDKSPMDMSYYPVDYPVLKIQDKIKEALVGRVIFSRPQKNGRVIFGDLVEYGKIWRLGANEATEIEFFQDVKMGGKAIRKGRYTLYAVTSPEKWTMILNKETDTWGAFKYDSTKDVLRTDIPVQKQANITEAFSMAFENKDNRAANLVIAWDDVLVKLPFSW